MVSGMDPILLARAQFAANMSFHILFPTITIAMGWLLLWKLMLAFLVVMVGTYITTKYVFDLKPADVFWWMASVILPEAAETVRAARSASSYNGSVHFGMLADRDLVPDLEQAREPAMRQIVATIVEDQYRMIEADTRGKSHEARGREVECPAGKT